MNGGEWSDIVSWVNDRWTGKAGWAPEQAIAYFDDLEQFAIEDVWSAMFTLYNRGLEFAPNGSMITAAATDARRAAAEQERYLRLPEPVEEVAAGGWLGFIDRKYGEPLTPTTALERLHADRTDCRNPHCDIHAAVTS